MGLPHSGPKTQRPLPATQRVVTVVESFTDHTLGVPGAYYRAGERVALTQDTITELTKQKKVK